MHPLSVVYINIIFEQLLCLSRAQLTFVISATTRESAGVLYGDYSLQRVVHGQRKRANRGGMAAAMADFVLIFSQPDECQRQLLPCALFCRGNII